LGANKVALAKEKVAEIEALLRVGELSKREISRRLGVSRVTIDKIEKKLFFPEEDPLLPKLMHFDQGDRHLSEENTPTYSRCKGCGGMQQDGIPCHVCKLRKRQMKEYDCYMEDLLKPQIVSPLSVKHKGSKNGKRS
jgi:hypothetical protein